MTVATQMHVTLQLPARLLYQGTAAQLFAVAPNGAFGMLPNHTDFVTALVPSVLIVTDPSGDERFFGIDEGLLVKIGHEVDIAIRRGVEGRDLDTLRDTVRESFAEMDDQERVARTATARLEANLVRHFTDLRAPNP